MLLKRAARPVGVSCRRLPKCSGSCRVVLAAPMNIVPGPFAEETRILLNAKISLLLMGVAYQKFMMIVRKAAGSSGRHHRRDHEHLCHGVHAVAHPKTGGVRQRRQYAAGYDSGAGARRNGPHRRHSTRRSSCLLGRRHSPDQPGGLTPLLDANPWIPLRSGVRSAQRTCSAPNAISSKINHFSGIDLAEV